MAGRNRAPPPEASALRNSTGAYIFFSAQLLPVSSHIPPALSQLALSVDLLMSPAAAEPGGEELCSFAPVDVSLLVPAVELPDMSSLASDPGGAELCSLAPGGGVGGPCSWL